MSNSKPLPEQLTEFLEREQVSARELSRRLQERHEWGSPTMVAGIARGEYSPSIAAMQHLSWALRIDPEEFPEYRLAVERERLDPERVGFPQAVERLTVIESAVAEAGLPDHWQQQERIPPRKYLHRPASGLDQAESG
jgi:transcriptional regulator with XRE-family HTH domain